MSQLKYIQEFISKVTNLAICYYYTTRFLVTSLKFLETLIISAPGFSLMYTFVVHVRGTLCDVPRNLCAPRTLLAHGECRPVEPPPESFHEPAHWLAHAPSE